MAAAGATAKPTKSANVIVTIVALTVLAVVGGGIVAKLIVARLLAVPANALEETVKASPYSGDVEVREIPAIVTNLADPPEMRVRLQISVVYDKKAVVNPAILVAEISDDVLAFLKTVRLPQLQGASGLQNLREDLNERAAIRSQGKVRELVIMTLVVQ